MQIQPEPTRRSLDVALPWWVGEILNDSTENRRFYITKGLGSGGTWGAACWHYLMCLYNRHSAFSWAVAPTYQQVQDTLIPTFAEVLQTVFGLEENQDYEVTASGRPRLYLKKYRQTIHFKSANRADRFVGPSISHLTMTEPGLYQPVAFEKATARLRCPKAIRLQQLWEGTPEGLGNRWQEEADFPEGVNEEKNARRVILWTEDNTHLKPSYVENLKSAYSYDAVKLESYLYGSFKPFTKGTAYWEFFDSRNVVLDVQPSPYLPIVFSWDFGVSPLPWVTLQQQPIRRKNRDFKRFVVIGEGDGKAKGVLDGVAQFIATFPPHTYAGTPIVIDGGHDGFHGSHLSESCAFDQILSRLRQYYSNVTIAASRSAPGHEESFNQINACFAYEILVVAAWCRNTIKSLTQSSFKEGTWGLLKKRGEDPTHFADALRAPIFRLTKGMDLEAPNQPKNFGMNKQL